jgi:fermentation-respiration switch protein FrsA (DUF1100 family)
MLIVQGGRDCQVTVDDLSKWQAALGGRPDVTIRIYEADNHLLFPGSSLSSAAEYEPAQHMEPEIITCAANWITSSWPRPATATPSPARKAHPAHAWRGFRHLR